MSSAIADVFFWNSQVGGSVGSSSALLTMKSTGFQWIASPKALVFLMANCRFWVLLGGFRKLIVVASRWFVVPQVTGSLLFGVVQWFNPHPFSANRFDELESRILSPHSVGFRRSQNVFQASVPEGFLHFSCLTNVSLSVLGCFSLYKHS